MLNKNALPIVAATVAVAALAALVFFRKPAEVAVTPTPAPHPASTPLERVVYGGDSSYKVFETVRADIDGDGDQDAVVILTQSPGGSGTFFSVAAAIANGESFVGTAPVLIGDRIAPQTVEYRDGAIVVNYADRNPGEPMTASPSLGKSMFLTLKEGALVVRPEAAPTKESCEGANGTWVEKFNECEYASADWCAGAKGTFNECASACRHEVAKKGEPLICTMQCVPLCTFPAK